MPDLNGASVCQTGTTTELNLTDYFRSKNMTYEVVAFRKERSAGYQEGRCDAYTATSRASMPRVEAAGSGRPVVRRDHLKEPLSPAVRQGDDGWFIVKWTLLSFRLRARGPEANVEGRIERNPESSGCSGPKRFRQGRRARGDGWVRIVEGVGNYGEILSAMSARTQSENCPRQGRPVDKGGLQYAPPIR